MTRVFEIKKKEKRKFHFQQKNIIYIPLVFLEKYNIIPIYVCHSNISSFISFLLLFKMKNIFFLMIVICKRKIFIKCLTNCRFSAKSFLQNCHLYFTSLLCRKCVIVFFISCPIFFRNCVLINSESEKCIINRSIKSF